MVVVVVETVIAAVVLTVDWRQVSGRRVDAVAFREAENVTLEVAVGAVAIVVVFIWVEGRVCCCALRESVS